ncbi:MAG: VIT1/CCC1 transporter family protein [Candidatus Paceibacterota bacterium]
MPHSERHRTERIGWLRAAVMGANDGIVSTASLILGVAAAHGTSHDILVAGVAGLVAGASIIFLTTLAGLAAFVGGASATRGAVRVTFWGALAMAITAGVGALFGTGSS